MITELKTISQILAEITSEEPNITESADKLYDYLKDGKINVYMVNNVPLLNKKEVEDAFEL